MGSVIPHDTGCLCEGCRQIRISEASRIPCRSCKSILTYSGLCLVCAVREPTIQKERDRCLAWARNAMCQCGPDHPGYIPCDRCQVVNAIEGGMAAP